MAMFRYRVLRSLLLVGPLAVTPLVAGCDSATGPKFPDPIEEEEDSTIEDGMNRRWSRAPVGLDGSAMATGVMPFTFAVRETT
jgi:hypothetical protein